MTNLDEQVKEYMESMGYVWHRYGNGYGFIPPNQKTVKMSYLEAEQLYLHEQKAVLVARLKEYINCMNIMDDNTPKLFNGFDKHIEAIEQQLKELEEHND